MTWTLGVFAITGDRKRINPLKIILNPPTIAVIIALPLFFCNVPIPEQIMTPIRYLGDMTLPLSMIILGLRLADMRLISLVNDWKVYMVAFVKLIVSPLLCLGVLMLCGRFLPIGSTVIIALYIIAAMPTASSALNFAEMYGGAKGFSETSTGSFHTQIQATIPNSPSETPQKMSSDKTSVIVVMKGFANTAGSMRIALAKIGTHAPTIFATITASAMETEIAAQLKKV